MTERPQFQFRMRDLIWAMSLLATSLGMGVATFRLAALHEVVEHQLGAGLQAALFSLGYLGTAVCFIAGVMRIFLGSRQAIEVRDIQMRCARTDSTTSKADSR